MFLIIIVFAGIVFYEVPNLIKEKYWREIIAFSLLLLIAFILAMLQAMGVMIPSPMMGIHYLLKNILHLSYE